MELKELFLMTIVAEILCIAISYYYWYKAKVLENRFRLFQVRDRFVRLVAANRLDENDEIYCSFVDFLNILINNTQRLHLGIFVKAIENATDERFKERRERYEALLKRVTQSESPEVRETVHEFFSAIIKILYDNSIVIRMLVRLRKLIDRLRKATKSRMSLNNTIISRIARSKKEYGLYREYQELDNHFQSALRVA